MATFRSKLLIPMLFASVACAQASEAQNIDHLAPTRDSVGAQPKKFEWTAVPGAEGYAFLLVNEIDIEIWETTLQATTLDLPTELVLDSGTYYWAVGAFRGGHQMAYSGRAAFVVLK